MESLVEPASMSLDCGKKFEYPAITHPFKGPTRAGVSNPGCPCEVTILTTVLQCCSICVLRNRKCSIFRRLDVSFHDSVSFKDYISYHI